jgi:DNA (cytosine-5)-methyltransferase 1
MKYDKIDLLSGGPPCQPFSIGGKHRAYNDKRDLFSEATRTLAEIRPKTFIFDNVRGLLRKSFAKYFGSLVSKIGTDFTIRTPAEPMELPVILEEAVVGHVYQ